MKYDVHMLVYFEQTTDITEALKREKQLKDWKRKWKIELIEKNNPHWKDLYKEIIVQIPGQARNDIEKKLFYQ